MRALSLLVVLALGLSAAHGQPLPEEVRRLKSQPPAINEVDALARIALLDLLAQPLFDQPYMRYGMVSPTIVPDEELDDFEAVLQWWLAHVTVSQKVYAPTRLAGGRLYRFDYRLYRWNASALRVVTQRDPYMIQPLVSDYVAQTLRQRIGEVIDEDLAKSDKYPVQALMRLDYLMREAMETQRSLTYYDLLYAQERYQEEIKVVRKIVHHRGGDYRRPDGKILLDLAPGDYHIDVHQAVQVKFKDFPANENDWNDFYGLKISQDFLRTRHISLTHAAVAPGSETDKKGKGSIVARYDRLLTFEPSGFAAIATKSYDNDVTNDDTDFLELAPAIALDRRAAKAKAFEYITTLPSGAIATFLADEKQNRIQIGGSQFVHNRHDSRFGDVRTPMHCYHCHAPDNGYIRPRNLVEELRKRGVVYKIKDAAKRQVYEEMFLEWDGKIEGWQVPYKAMLARLPKKAGKVRTGLEMVTLFLRYRDRYDQVLTPEGMALELGVQLEVFKLAVSISRKVRLADAMLGHHVPRTAWENTLYLESVKLLYLPPPERLKDH